MADEKKPLTTLQRIEILENALILTQRHFDETINSIRATIAGLALTAQGILIASGEEFEAKVQEAVDQKQKERADAKAAEGKAQIDALIAQGVLSVTDKAAPDSLLIGRVLDAEGNVRMPRLQKEFAALTPEAQGALLDQDVGYVWTSEDGNKFELLEIYKISLETPAPAEEE